MLNTVTDFKEIGFNSDTLGIDDITQDDNDKTALDRYIESNVLEAGYLLESLTGKYNSAGSGSADLKSRMTRAELLLGIRNMLELTWSKNTTSENMISIEGIQVQTYNLSLDRQKDIQDNLLQRAKQVVEPYLLSGSSSFFGALIV